ncbi:MAG: hypothetical protein ACREPM_23260 [Gemmatimonadaceae bacterium]
MIGPVIVQDQIPPEALHIVDSFFVTVAILALGIPIIRALIRRWERAPQLPPAPSAEVTTRLERIEQAVEAVAIEVERIAEAQRFAAKLMVEQQKKLDKSRPGADSPAS